MPQGCNSCRSRSRTRACSLSSKRPAIARPTASTCTVLSPGSRCWQPLSRSSSWCSSTRQRRCSNAKSLEREHARHGSLHCGRAQIVTIVKFAFVLDPLETIKTYKDSSFAMMEEAARRGHELFVLHQEHILCRDGVVR